MSTAKARSGYGSSEVRRELGPFTDENIRKALRRPATGQERLNALAVHSESDTAQERIAERQDEVRKDFGLPGKMMGSTIYVG